MKSSLFTSALIIITTTITAQKSITLDDIYRHYQFYPEGVHGINSMKDGEHYTVIEGRTAIVKYRYKTGKPVDTLLNLEDLEGAGVRSFFEYALSHDERTILIASNRESIYRHSYTADYHIYHLGSDYLKPLSEQGKQQLATFSPDGSMIAFVRENNLFVHEIASGKDIQVTYDGERNRIINGAPDWVYEEEFGFSKAFAWSPNNRYIAYYRTDESRVKEFSMTRYGELYPDQYSFKYPKAGEDNALVDIYVHYLLSGESTKIDLGEETDRYVPRIFWTADPEKLAIFKLNRLQNKLDLIFADPGNGKSNLILTEEEDAYISEVNDQKIRFLGDGRHFTWISEKDGYKHIYLYDYIEGNMKPITQGFWDVIEFLGVDEAADLVYYTAYEESSIESHLYRVRPDGTGRKKLTGDPGWHTAEFSDNFKYYILRHSTGNTAPVYGLYNARGRKIRELVDNASLNEKMESYGFTEKEFFTVENRSGDRLNAWMIKPRDFDPEKKYPLLMYVYGGPESQLVRDSWSHGDPWFQMLAQKGIIVACVDNRGTDGRGEAFRKATYMQLGKLETMDQIDAGTYLGSLPYIDENRIGMFGWSYGGYMTASCLFKGGGLFRAGIAVAPVTNWRFYDTIYTERFMRTPRENAEGYDENSPINHVEGLEGEFLLIHGMADDNVHFQNSVELAEALIQAGKQFEIMFYPNRDHGIYGGNATYHLRFMMTEFLLENLK